MSIYFRHFAPILGDYKERYLVLVIYINFLVTRFGPSPHWE